MGSDKFYGGREFTQNELKGIAESLVIANDLNKHQFFATIQCESGWDPDIQSNYIQDYGREDSWGISQIHLRAHTTITREQATDPVWALNWMKDQWVDNNQWMWSCYNNHFAQI